MTDEKSEKKRIVYVSWGDAIDPTKAVDEDARLNTRDSIESFLKKAKGAGFSRAYWRADTLLHFRHYDIDERFRKSGRMDYVETVREILSRIDPLECAVESAHRVNLEIYPRIDIFLDGCPEEVLIYTFRNEKPQPHLHQSRFSIEHPEYLAVDRGGRNRHWGVLELAYPEVREYKLGLIREVAEGYDVDGVFLMVPSHDTPPAYFGDQYGFNKPVVEEYERRYGVNILKGDFDLEAWRRLRGEYLTLFFREVKQYLSKTGKKLGLGIAQGDYLGPPYGNMHMDWRTWVEEGIADELLVGIVLDNYHHYSFVDNGYGYLCNPCFGIGLGPLDEDIRRVYGPHCRKHGCDLYIDPLDWDWSSVTPSPFSPEKYKHYSRIPELSGFVERPDWQRKDPAMQVKREKEMDIRTRGIAGREEKTYRKAMERHGVIPHPKREDYDF